jgi:hypothetical protein
MAACGAHSSSSRRISTRLLHNVRWSRQGPYGSRGCAAASCEVPLQLNFRRMALPAIFGQLSSVSSQESLIDSGADDVGSHPRLHDEEAQQC